jgi:hypothetical protein
MVWAPMKFPGCSDVHVFFGFKFGMRTVQTSAKTSASSSVILKPGGGADFPNDAHQLVLIHRRVFLSYTDRKN